jgi:hypothetical protein
MKGFAPLKFGIAGALFLSNQLLAQAPPQQPAALEPQQSSGAQSNPPTDPPRQTQPSSTDPATTAPGAMFDNQLPALDPSGGMIRFRF